MKLNIYKQHTETTNGRKTTNDASNALLRARALMMVLLCIAAFVCGTAVAADMYVPEGENHAISKAETASILQFENVKSNLTDAQQKLSTDILQLLGSTPLPKGQDRKTLEVQTESSGQFRPASSVSPTGGGRVTGDLIYVYVYLKPPAETQTIEPYVWEITDRDEENHLAVAWVEVKELETLASQEAVRTIRTVIPPLAMTGSVTTEGDAIHRTSDVRATYSQSGSGVKVGIISDGVDSWTDARDSGDLPADLTVLSNTQGGDDGTAMLEIVHDMVPDADLYFHDCGANTVAFSNAIDALVTAGCDVICDDIYWRLEPFFEDGVIASNLTSVLATNDIIYASSAGNAGQRHYQGDYYNISSSTQHDFSRGGTTGYYLYLQMQAGGSVRIVLQWNDQFGSSENDYDLYLINMNTDATVGHSTYVQDGDDDPLEFISYTVPGDTPTANYAIVVNKYSGVGKTLEVFIYPGSGCGVYSNNINATDSIFGHPAVPGVIAVGAIDASDPGNDDIEPFSSQGPVTISYPSPVSRAKPDLCGIDGVTVTGAGGVPSTFYGTSAAAPHVAAIAAQLWSAFPDSTGAEIRTVLYDSAVDLGSTGYDNIYGYGRADALDAFEAVIPCTCGDICVNETGWWHNNGTFTTSSTPIQSAVDNAIAGDTVCVKDSTYHENVDVDVGHLTIRSENGSTNCIVNALDSGDYVFDVIVDYVNITGFMVENATGIGKAGIHLSGREHCDISDNTAANNYDGIYLHSSSNDNTLTNNTANSNIRHGILLKNSSYCNVEHNTANNNKGFEGEDGGSPPSTGIVILGSHNTIRQNDASNNFIGIVVTSRGSTGYIVSANNTIEGNTASNNSNGGIHLGSSDNCTIFSNIVSYSGTQGIDIVDSWYCEVYDSIVSSSSDRGIVFSGGGNNTAHDNRVYNNSAFGAIEAISSDNNTFYNNTAYSNMWGIATNNASNNLIYNNIVYSNDHGIYLDWPSTGNKVYKNNISENDQGIVTNHNSHDNIITNNLIDSNDLGVLIVTDDNTVANNTVSNNDDGIHLYSSSNNTIYNNYFNNTNNAYDDGNNIWNITKTAGTNIVGGSWLGGNYWSDYTGVDNDGDRLGDTMLPCNSSGNIAYGGDWHPLTMVAPPPAPPAITLWSNDKTNDDSLNITVNESESVRFNATADQTITAWNWFNNGVAQPDNNDYYTTSWSVNGTYTASVNATNANGTSDTKMWTITVKSCDYDPADTNQDCIVSMMELMAHISKWKRGDVEMMELMTSIGRWKLGTGGYCQC